MLSAITKTLFYLLVASPKQVLAQAGSGVVINTIYPTTIVTTITETIPDSYFTETSPVTFTSTLDGGILSTGTEFFTYTSTIPGYVNTQTTSYETMISTYYTSYPSTTVAPTTASESDIIVNTIYTSTVVTTIVETIPDSYFTETSPVTFTTTLDGGILSTGTEFFTYTSTIPGYVNTQTSTYTTMISTYYTQRPTVSSTAASSSGSVSSSVSIDSTAASSSGSVSASGSVTSSGSIASSGSVTSSGSIASSGSVTSSGSIASSGSASSSSPAPSGSFIPSSSPVPSVSPTPSSDPYMFEYYGFAQAGTEDSLSYYCKNSPSGNFILGYVEQFGNGKSIGMKIYGHNGYFPGTNLLNAPDLGEEIQICQGLGKKIMLAIGGPMGDYGLSTMDESVAVAQDIWDLFGSGHSSTRPFGDAIVDGFVMDIHPANTLQKRDDSDNYYGTLVNTLNAFYGTTDRPYSMGATIGCDDDTLASTIASSSFDFVNVRFFDGCTVDSYSSLEQSVENSKNTNVALYVGLTADPKASGYLSPDELKSFYDSVLKQSPHFAGFQIYDASTSAANLIDGKPYSSFASSLLNSEPPTPVEPTSTTTTTGSATATGTSTGTSTGSGSGSTTTTGSGNSTDTSTGSGSGSATGTSTTSTSCTATGTTVCPVVPTSTSCTVRPTTPCDVFVTSYYTIYETITSCPPTPIC